MLGRTDLLNDAPEVAVVDIVVFVMAAVDKVLPRMPTTATATLITPFNVDSPAGRG